MFHRLRLWWLAQQLKSKNWIVWSHAAEALGKFRDDRALRPLLATLKGNHDPVTLGWFATRLPLPGAREQCGAAEALGELGDAQAVEPLVEALKGSGYGGLRQKAVEALGKLRDGRAIEPLVAALGDSEQMVRSACREALAALGWKPASAEQRAALAIAAGQFDQAVAEGAGAAFHPLALTLKDCFQEVVRKEAAAALGRLGDARAVQPLVTALKKADGYDSVRCAAAEALGKLRAEGAVEPLLAALKDHSDKVKDASADALGKLGDMRAVEPLVAILKDPWHETQKFVPYAARALACLAAFEPLVTALGDRKKIVRSVCKEALKAQGWKPDNAEQRAALAIAEGQFDEAVAVGTEAFHPLVAVLKNCDEVVLRTKAVDALGRLGDMRAVGPLAAALSDYSHEVRSSAAVTLGKLGAADSLVIGLEGGNYKASLACYCALKKVPGFDISTVDTQPLVNALVEELRKLYSPGIPVTYRTWDPETIREYWEDPSEVIPASDGTRTDWVPDHLAINELKQLIPWELSEQVRSALGGDAKRILE